jgi:hypothetical protein
MKDEGEESRLCPEAVGDLELGKTVAGIHRSEFIIHR